MSDLLSRYHDIGRLGYFNHARMVEDLLSTAGLMADISNSGRIVRPPQAWLVRLGQDFLHATTADSGAWRLKVDDHLVRQLDQLTYDYVPYWNFRVSWYVAAIVFGRRDLREKFIVGGQLKLESALQWVILYGVREHALYRFLTARFIDELIEVKQMGPDICLSMLQYLIILERPDLFSMKDCSRGAKFREEFQQWLIAEGVRDYGLLWLLSWNEIEKHSRFHDPLNAFRGDDSRIMPAPVHQTRLLNVVDLLAAPMDDDDDEDSFDAASGSRTVGEPSRDPLPIDGVVAHIRFDDRFNLSAHPGLAGSLIKKTRSQCTFSGPLKITIGHQGIFRPFILILDIGLHPGSAADISVKRDGKLLYVFPAQIFNGSGVQIPIAGHADRLDPFTTIALEIISRDAALGAKMNLLPLRQMWVIKSTR
jgi:hypothetical protein